MACERSSSNSSKSDFAQLFVTTVARAHLRNVSRSVQPPQVMMQIKAEHAKALALALFFSPAAAPTSTSPRRDPKLVADLMRALAWSPGSGQTATWELCFNLYEIDKQQQHQQRSLDTILSLIYAVMHAPSSRLSADEKKLKMNQVAAELLARRRAEVSSAEIDKRQLNRIVGLLSASALVDVKMMEQLLQL
jgi:hypothetical protein